jgi:hypothetical protein
VSARIRVYIESETNARVFQKESERIMKMNTSAQIRLISISCFFTVAAPELEVYIYDDEEQLAAGLAEQQPEGLAFQPLATSEIDPDDFEKLYNWFLS